MKILSNHCVVASQPKTVQAKFAPIIHPSISNHWVVGGLNVGVFEGRRRMESRDQVMALCGSSLHSNHFKLSDITAGKLSVKSQFITHDSNKVMASEWCQWSTRGFHRVRIKLQQKADLQVCRMKVHWTSSPFLVKF